MKHWSKAVVALLAGAWISAAAAADGIKVIYHINAGIEQAVNGLRNIRNHLEADPGAKIVVVAHSAGIDFLLDGAKDKNGNPFDAIVQGLKTKNVEFRACRKTFEQRKISESLLIPEASLVPSGVAEVARLQAKEGFVYLRP